MVGEVVVPGAELVSQVWIRVVAAEHAQSVLANTPRAFPTDGSFDQVSGLVRSRLVPEQVKTEQALWVGEGCRDDFFTAIGRAQHQRSCHLVRCRHQEKKPPSASKRCL